MITNDKKSFEGERLLFVELLAVRISFANLFSWSNYSFLDIRKEAFLAVENDFSKAYMLEGQPHFEHGKRVILELLKRKQLRNEEYVEAIGYKAADQLLLTNVFFLDPNEERIGFQSPLTFAYAKEVYEKGYVNSNEEWTIKNAADRSVYDMELEWKR